eukprot:3989813-Alexandrium_andersonii.AAC.1
MLCGLSGATSTSFVLNKVATGDRSVVAGLAGEASKLETCGHGCKWMSLGGGGSAGRRGKRA